MDDRVVIASFDIALRWKPGPTGQIGTGQLILDVVSE